VIIAPGAEPAALEALQLKPNLRVLLSDGLPDPRRPGLDIRTVGGGFLVQSRDAGTVRICELRWSPGARPRQELADLQFAFRVVKHVKSNAIVYARDGATVGIGAGQMSRVDSSRIATWKSGEASRAAGLEASGNRIGGGVGRLLSVPRRGARGGRGGRHRRHPARRIAAR
jgi:phosphoribosylaminoimidazolecarboxamide formyltransferase / IMP cyclohydrolase